MGAIIAGLAVGAIGAGVSAAGTAQNASATRDQAKFNAYLENRFGKKWLGLTEDFIQDKEEKLYGIADIFDRFEGGGAFGDTDTLANLRKAQSDFSNLAAGNFEGFESQLRAIMQDNLVNTFGSGAPIGSYTQLSADSIMNLRRTGLSDALTVTNNLDQLSNNLLGLEFGVMDQSYNLRYGIDRARLSAITGYGSQAAATAGVGTQAAGGALTSIGTSLMSYGTYQGNMNLQQQYIDAARAGGGSGTPINMPRTSPAAYSPYSAPSVPSINTRSFAVPNVPSVSSPVFPTGNVNPVDGSLLPPRNDYPVGITVMNPNSYLGPVAPSTFPSGSGFYDAFYSRQAPAAMGTPNYGLSPFASINSAGFNIASR